MVRTFEKRDLLTPQILFLAACCLHTEEGLCRAGCKGMAQGLWKLGLKVRTKPIQRKENF